MYRRVGIDAIFNVLMQTILLLHGATGASPQLYPLAQALCGKYKVFTLDFSGHGGRAYSGEPYSMRLFADDVLQFMEQHQIAKVSIFGYSLGGYVGIYLAKHYPEKVDRVITLATKFNWDEATAAREIKMLDPVKIAEKLPDFAKTLEKRHAPDDWKDVLAKTRDLMIALGNDNTLKINDYAEINTPVMVLIGDRDKMVSLDETVRVYKALPNAQFCVVPNTAHPVEQIDAELFRYLIARFLA